MRVAGKTHREYIASGCTNFVFDVECLLTGCTMATYIVRHNHKNIALLRLWHPSSLRDCAMVPVTMCTAKLPAVATVACSVEDVSHAYN